MSGQRLQIVTKEWMESEEGKDWNRRMIGLREEIMAKAFNELFRDSNGSTKE